MKQQGKIVEGYARRRTGFVRSPRDRPSGRSARLYPAVCLLSPAATRCTGVALVVVTPRVRARVHSMHDTHVSTRPASLLRLRAHVLLPAPLPRCTAAQTSTGARNGLCLWCMLPAVEPGLNDLCTGCTVIAACRCLVVHTSRSRTIEIFRTSGTAAPVAGCCDSHSPTAAPRAKGFAVAGRCWWTTPQMRTERAAVLHHSRPPGGQLAAERGCTRMS